MTAINADRNSAKRDGKFNGVKIAASTVIHAGVIVCANASGFAIEAIESATITCLGVSEGYVNYSAGAAGDKRVNVARQQATKLENHATDPVTQASVGKSCYVADNQTVAATSNTNTRSVAGIVLSVESDGVWVFI